VREFKTLTAAHLNTSRVRSQPAKDASFGYTYQPSLDGVTTENRDLPLSEEPFKTALDVAEFLDGCPYFPLRLSNNLSLSSALTKIKSLQNRE